MNLTVYLLFRTATQARTREKSPLRRPECPLLAVSGLHAKDETGRILQDD